MNSQVHHHHQQQQQQQQQQQGFMNNNPSTDYLLDYQNPTKYNNNNNLYMSLSSDNFNETNNNNNMNNNNNNSNNNNNNNNNNYINNINSIVSEGLDNNYSSDLLNNSNSNNNNNSLLNSLFYQSSTPQQQGVINNSNNNYILQNLTHTPIVSAVLDTGNLNLEESININNNNNNVTTATTATAATAIIANPVIKSKRNTRKLSNANNSINNDDNSNNSNNNNNISNKASSGSNSLNHHGITVACINCHQSKTACSTGERPCKRCIKLGKAHLCIDRPSKVNTNKKTKLEKNNKKQNSQDISDNNYSHSNDILNGLDNQNNNTLNQNIFSESGNIVTGSHNPNSSNSSQSSHNGGNNNNGSATTELCDFILSYYKSALTRSILEHHALNNNAEGMHFFLAYLYRLMHMKNFISFLKFIGYKPQLNDLTDYNSESVIHNPKSVDFSTWIVPLKLLKLRASYITGWSYSPLSSVGDHELTNFATMIVGKPRPNDNLSVVVDESVFNYNNNLGPLEIIVQTNLQFERLFGYNQSEIREQFILQAEDSLSLITKQDCLHLLHRMDMRKLILGQLEFSGYVNCINKSGFEFPALLHKRVEIDKEKGASFRAYLTWIPTTTLPPSVFFKTT